MDTDYRNKGIDWPYWLALPYVSAWDAVSLSLQINPDSWDGMQRRYSSGPGGGYIPSEGLNRKQARTLDEQNKRYTLLLRCVQESPYFSPASGNMQRDRDVRLREVSAWLYSLKRDPPLPFELAALAREYNFERPATRVNAKPVEEVRLAGPKDWKEAAVRFADEEFDKDSRMGVRDKLEGYAKRVMKRLQDEGIHGPRGRIDNARTVQRDALQGSKWWAKKNK